MGYNKNFYKITFQKNFSATFIIMFFRLHFIYDKFVDTFNYKQLQRVHKRAIVGFYLQSLHRRCAHSLLILIILLFGYKPHF